MVSTRSLVVQAPRGRVKRRHRRGLASASADVEWRRAREMKRRLGLPDMCPDGPMMYRHGSQASYRERSGISVKNIYICMNRKKNKTIWGWRATPLPLLSYKLPGRTSRARRSELIRIQGFDPARMAKLSGGAVVASLCCCCVVLAVVLAGKPAAAASRGPCSS